VSIRFTEKPGSRSVSYNPPTFRYLYTLAGTIDHAIAWSYAAAALPAIVSAAGQVLYRQDVKCDHVGHDVWDVEAPYGPRENTVGEYRFSFSTTGGTLRIRQAKEHIATFPNGNPEHDGAIDVQGREVQGADIVIPALKLSYTFRHPAGYVNESLAVNLARLTGRTNSAIWHGFKIGEALFLGANGSDGTTADAEVTYEIAASEELTNATIGAITGVDKKGWEIAWAEFEDDEDAGAAIQKVKSIHVERVYDSFNFASQLGF